MRYTVVKSFIQVVGKIWMPPVTAVMEYTISSHDLENIKAKGDGEITREAVEDWLSSNSGDFQSITDFRADISYDDTDIVFEWSDPESELIYNDGVYGDE